MRTVLIAMLLAGCFPKHKNQCPGNATAHCVNGEVCSFDSHQNCQICQCRPYDQIPTGQDPDDPGKPPER